MDNFNGARGHKIPSGTLLETAEAATLAEAGGQTEAILDEAGEHTGAFAGEQTGAATLAGEQTGAATSAGEQTGAATSAGEHTGAATLAGEHTGAATFAGEQTGAATFAGEHTGAATFTGEHTGAAESHPTQSFIHSSVISQKILIPTINTNIPIKLNKTVVTGEMRNHPVHTTMGSMYCIPCVFEKNTENARNQILDTP